MSRFRSFPHFYILFSDLLPNASSSIPNVKWRVNGIYKNFTKRFDRIFTLFNLPISGQPLPFSRFLGYTTHIRSFGLRAAEQKGECFYGTATGKRRGPASKLGKILINLIVTAVGLPSTSMWPCPPSTYSPAIFYTFIGILCGVVSALITSGMNVVSSGGGPKEYLRFIKTQCLPVGILFLALDRGGHRGLHPLDAPFPRRGLGICSPWRMAISPRTSPRFPLVRSHPGQGLRQLPGRPPDGHPQRHGQPV